MNRIHETVSYISTFVITIIVWIYLCCWIISPRGYHPLCSKCISTDMI